MSELPEYDLFACYIISTRNNPVHLFQFSNVTPFGLLELMEMIFFGRILSLLDGIKQQEIVLQVE